MGDKYDSYDAAMERDARIEEDWDRAEAEMLEQVNPLTGEPTVRLDLPKAKRAP